MQSVVQDRRRNRQQSPQQAVVFLLVRDLRLRAIKKDWLYGMLSPEGRAKLLREYEAAG